jgi:hypothetical protein
MESKTGMVAHAYDASTQKAEAGESQVQGLPGETPISKNKTQDW